MRAALKKLIKFSEGIKKVARQRMAKLRQSEKLDPNERTATREERRVDERGFVLSTAEFRTLLTVSKMAASSKALNDDDEDEGQTSEMTRPLMLLRDFSGEGNMQVLLGHSFDWKGHGSLWVCRPVDGWNDLLEGGDARDLTLLDATAGLDPRYLLQDQFAVETVPDACFPRTTIVLMENTSKTAISKKENAPEEVVDQLVQQVAGYLDEIRAAGDAVLVLTDLEMEPRIRSLVELARTQGKLPAKTVVDHFGGLRGRNDYDQFSAVYFTQPYVYPEEYYLGLGLLLHGFSGDGVTRQWSSKNSWPKYLPVRARAIASDIYQDATRIQTS